MSYFRIIFITLSFFCSFLGAAELTIASYNCGGLSHHYDYLRAACMQKWMQERFNEEPELMALNEKVQKVALKKLFASEPERTQAKREWRTKGYGEVVEQLAGIALNAKWAEKASRSISDYRVRPVVINDSDITQMVQEHLKAMTLNTEADEQLRLDQTRAKMARSIFQHQLNYDLICLQEADYLNSPLFPTEYEVLLSPSSHSVNGLAWKKERFELVKVVGDVMGRALVLKLRDKASGKTFLIASGHLTGCNPFHPTINPATGQKDSIKGDDELRALIALMESEEANLKIIGMDSNVTAMHPRLKILKDADYQIDAENFFETTCTNPYQMLNTRIDWIATQPKASLTNIPVLGVGLNSIQTNMSDHKPIAAKIKFD